jgi:glycosyltransferase involved in cell wall biosynthesis
MTAKKKILFLIPSLRGGGAERVFLILLRYLDRSRFEPHLAILRSRGEYAAELPADVMVHKLGVARVRYALPGIVRLIWKIRPQTVLSTLGHMNMAILMARPLLPRGIRLLVRETIIASSENKETSHPRLWAWLYRRFYGKADAIICLSDSMVEDLVLHFGLPREKMVRIYNPVDKKRINELAEVEGNPFSGPGPGPHLVAIGRLSRQKGFDVLLDAMPAVLEKLPAARLSILGEGPLRGVLWEQTQRLGLDKAVSFPGFQPNPWAYLKHADVFVLSSRYEGLSNVLLEALALGTPVVATDCPSAIREVRVHAPGIVLVPPEDSQALAHAINIVCGEKRDPQHAAQLSAFDPQKVVAEYSSLL